MKDFLYLNRTRFHTYAPNEAGCATGLSTVHASNFRFISARVPFDVFALETSNDMFVRKGIEEKFDKFACGCNSGNTQPVEWWSNNSWIPVMSKFVALKTIEKQPQEGAFYPSEVFKEVADIVLDKIGGLLASEELILHTLALNLHPELYKSNSGRHYVFHNPTHAATTEVDILRVRRGESDGHYAVKRVPRSMSHPCRIFVNKLTEND